MLVCAVTATVLLFTFAARVVLVSGPSMRETLQHQDCLLVVNAHLCGGFEAGDIVIIRKESFKDGEPIVKRVIATEGQTVDIDYESNSVYVDGERLDEPYIKEVMQDVTQTGPYRTQTHIEVPEGSIFVMGDNRNNSTDSRDTRVGCVDERDIMGAAVLRVLPFGKIGAAQ